MKKYRLLRNNKESGPFTAADIIQMGLKPYDLIWVDGKSAAWRYPGEMEEFKAHAPMVEEQPFDRFFKKEINTVATAGGSAATIAQPMAATIAKEKPRIRIRAEWNKIGAGAAAQIVNEKPAAAATMERPVILDKPIDSPAAKPLVAESKPATEQKPAAQIKNTPKPSWESSWLDWQQEQNAVTHASKTADAKEAAAVLATRAAAVDDEPVLETKFTQSLNDIKEKYTATVLKAKTKAVEWRKFKSVAILAMLAIPVMAFGIWVGQKWSGGTTDKNAVVKSIIPPAQVSNVEATEPADNTQPAPEEKKAEEPNKNNSKEMIPQFEDNSAKAEAKQKATKKLGKTHYLPIIPNGAVTKKDNRLPQPMVKKPLPQQQPAQQRYAFTKPQNINPNARNKTVNPALLNQGTNPSPNRQQANNQAVARKGNNNDDDDNSPIFSHTSKKQKITDFVDVSTEESMAQNVQNLHLNVQNIADFRLDLVVVDVEYFDANNRFRTGQTVYLKNVPAGETMNVKVPDNPNATRIRYKVSLVSAEQKGVYLIGE